MVEIFEGLTTLIHGDDLSFTRAAGSLAFANAAPGEGATHASDNVTEEGSDFVIDDGASVAGFGNGGILRTPIGVGPNLGEICEIGIGAVYPGNEAFSEGAALGEANAMVSGTAKPSQGTLC
jgi:hypothetical protein